MERSERQDQKEQRERQYHHGDLRRALLDAALQLANERGLANFTLREVARLAGVSHNAPYHHFADKAALVEALVIENFEALTEELRAAEERTVGTSLDTLCATGVAYVNFALHHPAAFRLMFRPELYEHTQDDEDTSREIELAGQAAYQILLNTIYACQQADLIAVERDLNLLALTAWSTVHGLAVLLLDSSPQRLLSEQIDEEQLARQVTQTLIAGLMGRKNA